MIDISEVTTPAAALDELLQSGTTTLKANSRDDIYQQAETLVASLPKEVKWERTIVQYAPDTFSFSQTYTIKK